MAIKLHRCGNLWVKLNGHPCWRVQKALDEMGVEYEVVKESWPGRKGRTAVIENTGQSGLPAIELEDGSWCREESAEMAKAIRAGKFSTQPSA
jgi:glutaredoxin